MASVRNTKARIPPILGWFTEHHCFTTLHKVLLDNLGKNGMKLGLIRGPDFANVDGGLIVNPPEDFPSQDLTATLEWLRQQQDDRSSRSLQIYRFDCKAGSSPPRANQWVPFYLVMTHMFPQYVCIVPMRSWRGVYRALKRTTEDAITHTLSQLSLTKELIFNDVLAPYAVHEDDLYEALTCIVNASLQKLVYVNPTNGIEYHGWNIPPPDTTVCGLLAVHDWKQEASENAIERLYDFMRDVPDMRLESNPLAPLVCDMFLYDEQEQQAYHIEHKFMSTDRNNKYPLLSLPSRFCDPKSNWHFLLKQTEEDLVIFTRAEPDNAATAQTKPFPMKMLERASHEEFAKKIRDNGPIAKARLREKWKDVEVYNDASEFISQDTSGEAEAEPASKHRPTVDAARMRIVFQAQINQQCCKLGRHVCISLHNHPTADAVIVEHEWTIQEQELYRSSGMIPVSLAARSITIKRCILLVFIPHTMSGMVASTSQYFEPATSMGWSYPECTAQDFVFVAMTGGFRVPDQLPCLDTVVLLPSCQTTIIPDTSICTICDDRNRPRQWNWVKGRILNYELARASKGKPFSLPATPYMKPGAEPFKRIYTLEDGSVHDFFDQLFTHNDIRLTTTIHGPSGLLQRQWNHGDMTLSDDSKVDIAYRLIQRILVGWNLPRVMQNQPFVTDFDKDYQKFYSALETGGLLLRKRYAMEKIVNETDRGISLRKLIESSGFAAGNVKLCCDSCSNEEECKFLNPEIIYALPDDDYSCGHCYRRERVSPNSCKFRNLPEDLLHRLRTSIEFRAHVPCHECWKNGETCDNNSGTCKNCAEGYMSCIRIACEAFQEPRDNWFCPRTCDKAHFNDGYNNVVEYPRPRQGYNARIAARKGVTKADKRTAVCTSCWLNHADQKCTNAEICPPCVIRIQRGDSISCKRTRCDLYTTCSRVNCKYAHATQNFKSDTLINYIPFPRRLQGKLRYPYV